MIYNADRPIDNCDQDLLGRATFSKNLGRAIFDYCGSDGLVIGLYGKWGTGKTSVLNMAISELRKLSSNEDSMPLIMNFSPWNYSDKDNLISIFFQELKSKIEIQKNDLFRKKVGEALSNYSSVFDALSFIPFWGPVGATILKKVIQAKGKKLKQEYDLDTTRRILESALLEANKKIIIFIDDIDRLTNSQIRDVFQLVKQVADFPNVIYVLAMDRDIVRKALSEVHKFDGNEYLEKIIQIPFELPELRKSKLHEIFFHKLDQILSSIPQKVEWDPQYWSMVFQNCVAPYINTLRDINRVINAFQFRYGVMYQETSFEDMVAITTIEVLEPELYKWIINNKESVCGGFMHSLLHNRDHKNDYRKQYIEEYSKLGINPEKSIKCISTLFPVFAKDVDEHHVDYQSSSGIRGKMRIACEGRFDLYFIFDLDDVKVSRNIINAWIFDKDIDELQTIMNNVNKMGDMVYFLEEVNALIDEIPYERLGMLASAIIGFQEEFHGESARAIFAISAFGLAEHLVTDIIKRLKTEEERNSIISDAVDSLNKSGLVIMARIINRIELSYGRLSGNTEKKEDQIISLKHLRDLEQEYVTKVRRIATTETLLDIGNFYQIFYLWESFDKDGVKKYVSELFKDDFQKLRFVCAMAGRWNGTDGSGWDFYSKYYSTYVSDEEIYNLILNFDKKRLDDFTNIEQIKLASFVLNYQKDEIDHVNEQDALMLVEKWKHNNLE